MTKSTINLKYDQPGSLSIVAAAFTNNNTNVKYVTFLIVFFTYLYWIRIGLKIHPITTALMPLSQVISWYALYKHNVRNKTLNDDVVSLSSLFIVLHRIALFYCFWALLNNILLGGITKDLGMMTLGFLSIATYVQSLQWSIIGTILVLINYTLPSYFLLYAWDVQTIAHKVKHDNTRPAIMWVYTAKVYFISNLFLWSYVFRKLMKIRMQHRHQREPVAKIHKMNLDNAQNNFQNV